MKHALLVYAGVFLLASIVIVPIFLMLMLATYLMQSGYEVWAYVVAGCIFAHCLSSLAALLWWSDR